MIQVTNLSKTFQVHKKIPGMMGSIKSLFYREWIEKHALKNATLQVEPGEILGLVGANGAGKTTLVKMLAGIMHPSSGDAKVLGYTPWERDNRFRSQISLIMGQKAQLWWDLPAEDCYQLLKEIYQLPDKEYSDSLAYLTDALGVRDVLNIQIRRLSLGERMKMELIAALLHKPKVVYLDEPTIGLDLTAQRAIRKFLLDYRKEHKPAMILTSHYMEDIERLCKRIVIIKEGEFVYDGALSSVINKYATHKILSVTVDPDVPLPTGLSVPHAELTNNEAGILKFKADRNQITQVAQNILQKFKVKDLSIEEEDIGNIIEQLIRKDKR